MPTKSKKKNTTRTSKPRAKKAHSKSAAKVRQKMTRPKKLGVALLSGGNPQIAKGDGDAPVQAYISAIQDWKRDTAKRIDAVIESSVPNVRKAVKWNSPFYGVDGESWFLSFHIFDQYVKVAFFRGAELRPLPPGASKSKDVRYLDIHEGEFDESQLAKWVKQAAEIPGWTP